MPEKHGPQSSPWDLIGVRQTKKTGGRTTSAAEWSIVRQAGLGAGSVLTIHMTPILGCPHEPEEAL